MNYFLKNCNDCKQVGRYPAFQIIIRINVRWDRCIDVTVCVRACVYDVYAYKYMYVYTYN